ncbi:UNVERIFIED_ORG: hypothetical protein QFZ59_001787 [Bacillus sp. B2I3]|nr:hypothetical protein [Bacillus sp. B2I3]
MQLNENNLKQKMRFFEKVNIFFLYLIICWSLTPYLMRNTNEILVLLIFTGWWISTFIFLINRRLDFNKKGFFLFSITVIWIVIVSLYIAAQLPNFSFGNYFYIILYYMPIFLFAFYLKYGSMSIYKKIIMFAFGVIIVNSIINIIILFQNPYAAKEATGGYGLNNYSGSNILTDIFIFAYVLAAYATILGVRYFSNKIIKYFFMILSIILIFMVIQSTFFISIISLVFIMGCFYMIKGENKGYNYMKFLILILSFSVFIIFKNNISSAIDKWIVSVTDNYIIIQRVQAISKLVLDFGFEGSLSARMKDLNISINTFLEYPFLGKGYLLSSDILSTGIGMHSHLLDDLARFGIMGFTFEIMVYIVFIIYVINNLDKKLRKHYMVSWIGFVFYAFFNPIVYPPTGIMLFFIFPLYVFYLSKKSNTTIQKRL